MHLVPDSDAVPAPEKVEASEGAEKESADEKAVGAGELSSASTSIAEACKLFHTLGEERSFILFVLYRRREQGSCEAHRHLPIGG